MSVVEVDRLFTERMYEEAAALAAKGLQKGGHSDDVAKLLSRRSEVRARHVRAKNVLLPALPPLLHVLIVQHREPIRNTGAISHGKGCGSKDGGYDASEVEARLEPRIPTAWRSALSSARV